MFQFFEYIKFIFKSTNQHGVHSPFVYDLVTNCFYDTSKHQAYTNILAYRNALLNSTEIIDITDFGAGSKVFSKNKRIVREIAKTSGTTKKRAKLLHRIVKYFEPKHILELGTSLGIATYTMALGNFEHAVISLEGCPQTSKFTKAQLTKFNVKNISIITNEFEASIPELKNQKFDLIFFDGNHTKAATLQYFEELIATAHNDSIFIFDDIHWSKDMSDAWNTIKSHSKVTVTIDTFFWGLVSFRKEQAKENFVIRV